MKESRKLKHKKRYSKISIQKRLKLAQMVLEEGQTLTKVAKVLRIKRPTAKVILKRYKQNGTVFQKKMGQIKTKESIGSQNELKIEQKSEENVSIEIEPEELPKQPIAEVPPQIRAQQQRQIGNIGFVYYFSPFPQLHSFM